MPETAHADITLDDIQIELLKIENNMSRVGAWSLHDRWKSGRLLLQLRNPETGYLSKGRLTTVAATLKVSARELGNRMRVADSFRTDAEFRKAAAGHSWSRLVKSLPLTRELREGQVTSARARSSTTRLHQALAYVLAEQVLTGERRRLAQKLYDALDEEGE